MTHLPYSTDFPKPGSTLTAAQANALPVGSVVDYADGGASNPVYRDSEGYWRFEHDNSMVGGAKELISPPYTLVRYGPAAFAVGDVVTAAQCNELPDGSVVDDNGAGPAIRREKRRGEWVYFGEAATTPMSSVWTYTIVSLPHSSHAAESHTNPHATGSLDWARWAAEREGVCVRVSKAGLLDIHRWRGGKFENHYPSTNTWGEAPKDNSIHHHPGPWAIVPDPSAAETPVETSEERFAALMQQMGGLSDERDALKSEDLHLRERIKNLRAVAGRLRTENADLLATAEVLKRERDAAISEIGKSCATMAKAHAEEVKGIKAELSTALQRAEKAEATTSRLRTEQAELSRDYTQLQAEYETLEAAAKVVVPEDVRKACLQSPGGIRSKFILSLADHLPAPKQMVQSTHPEGSREWAEDAMRQGFSVTHQYADDVCWKDFACTDGRKWKGRGMADTGWRIHKPAVAPSTEPSVAQMAASIEALNERLDAIETRLSDVEASV